jgi:hypothetical protein
MPALYYLEAFTFPRTDLGKDQESARDTGSAFNPGVHPARARLRLGVPPRPTRQPHGGAGGARERAPKAYRCLGLGAWL